MATGSRLRCTQASGANLMHWLPHFNSHPAIPLTPWTLQDVADHAPQAGLGFPGDALKH
jgi:hypothetical protein